MNPLLAPSSAKVQFLLQSPLAGAKKSTGGGPPWYPRATGKVLLTVDTTSVWAVEMVDAPKSDALPRLSSPRTESSSNEAVKDAMSSCCLSIRVVSLRISLLNSTTSSRSLSSAGTLRPLSLMQALCVGPVESCLLKQPRSARTSSSVVSKARAGRPKDPQKDP